MTLSRRRLRHFWVQFHLWPGLLLGAVFALLGLTGSVLCFYPELDLWLNPAQQVTCLRRLNIEQVYRPKSEQVR